MAASVRTKHFASFAIASTARFYSTTVHPVSLSAFNSNHENYDKYRPTHYKPAVDSLISHLKLKQGDTVIDLAAGTGKFTELLIPHGFNLSAVEISDGMLESLRKNFPNIKSRKGSSYYIPVQDSSVDAVLSAQAFHWFADLKSLSEIHRVLKPNGKLGLIWNFDPSVPGEAPEWQRKVAELCWKYDEGLPQFRKSWWKEVFQTPEAARLFKFPYQEETHFWTFQVPKESVWHLWETKSYITKLDDVEKSKVKAQVDDIVKEAKVDSQGLVELRLGVYSAWTTKKID
ncbi:S-adenosyl-L-methionine-dependent methyltransferase [Lipomyces japonicus]|uniref:S-adenosyl-L-methionine-dependent methyltransferase n=1 Tax=Lipomyces japonicus TaxID=56871 RepID=UPI0034CFCDFC